MYDNGDRYSLFWDRLRNGFDNNNADDLLQLLVDIRDIPDLADMVVTVKRCIGQILAHQESSPPSTDDPLSFSSIASGNRTRLESKSSNDENETMNVLLENLKKTYVAPNTGDSVFDAFLGNMNEAANEEQMIQHAQNENGDATFVMEILPAVVG